MAWLEKDTRTGLFKVAIRLSDGKLKRSLKTTNRREAESLPVHNSLRNDSRAARFRKW